MGAVMLIERARNAMDSHFLSSCDDGRKVRNLLEELGGALLSAQEDARRWRALMGSQRVRVIGSAGLIDPETREPRAPADGYMHIGVEIWSLHNAPHPSAEFPQDRCRAQLTAYVDFLAAQPGEG